MVTTGSDVHPEPCDVSVVAVTTATMYWPNGSIMSPTVALGVGSIEQPPLKATEAVV